MCVCVCVCVLHSGWNTPSTLRGASVVAQMVKNLPAMQETWVWSLGQEYALEKGMAIQSSILAWKNPINRRTWWFTVCGVTKSWTRLTHTHTHTSWHPPDISDSTLVRICYFFNLNLFLIEDNCFTILCWFLPYINMNQPQDFALPLPLHGALAWAPCITQEIPTGYLFYIW